MGVIICKKHNRQGIVHISDTIEDGINNSNFIELIYKIELVLILEEDNFEDGLFYFIDSQSFNTIKESEHSIHDIQVEWSRAIPYCGKCFHQYVKNNNLRIQGFSMNIPLKDCIF